MQQLIDNSLFYALSLVNIPYRWYKAGEKISGEDKFYAKNDIAPSSKEIWEKDLSIVCTGLINLMRRYNGLNIPGLDGILGEEGLEYPGTTGIWFEYLQSKELLEPINTSKKYPRGTLLLRNFRDIENDQGHVAVLLTNLSDSIMDENIIHSYSNYGYEESIMKNIVDVGITGISSFRYSHSFDESGYYTHICLPENWLIKN